MKNRKPFEIQLELEKAGWVFTQTLTNVRTRIKCFCPNKHEHFRQFVGRVGCKECAGSNSITLDRVSKAFLAKGFAIKQDYVKNNRERIKFECEKGHLDSISWSNFTQGYGCASCSEKPKTPTIEDVEKKFKEKDCTLLSKGYKNSTTPLDYLCPKGHKATIKLQHFDRGQGCNVCKKERFPDINKIEKAFKGRGWTLHSKLYTNSHSKLDFTCPEGHNGSMTWSNFSRGAGCYECNPGGFNYNKPGYLYYVRFETLNRRFNKESRPFKILNVKYFESGLKCAEEERRILNKYSQFRWKGSRLLHSGSSELFVKDVLMLDRAVLNFAAV
jgi:hypothetical protein